MGIITVLLYSTGYLNGEFHIPHWVAISCYIAIGLGTLSGGWKIIETMGGRITKLSHHQGFAASTGGSIMVFTASLLAAHGDRPWKGEIAVVIHPAPRGFEAPGPQDEPDDSVCDEPAADALTRRGNVV